MLLSANSVLCIEQLSFPAQSGQGSQSRDFLILVTSDLLIHTIELKEPGNDDNSGANQIRILSTLDCKTEMPSSELPKLKRLIMSGMMKDLDGGDILLILFENLAYFTVSFGVEEKAAQFPVVESFTKSELEMDPFRSLIEVVSSPHHLYRIVQNQPQPDNEDKTHGQVLEIYSLSQDRYDSKELEKHKEMFLPDNFYAAIGLRGLGAFHGHGAVLVGTEAIMKVNDLSFEMS